MKKSPFLYLTLLCAAPLAAQPPHPCAGDAVQRAMPLLQLHYGEADERMSIDDKVKTMRPITNPAAKGQQFDVLEVWGHIYRGDYRMHFIYAQLPGECLLMGQEILEFSEL